MYFDLEHIFIAKSFSKKLLKIESLRFQLSIHVDNKDTDLRAVSDLLQQEAWDTWNTQCAQAQKHFNKIVLKHSLKMIALFPQIAAAGTNTEEALRGLDKLSAEVEATNEDLVKFFSAWFTKAELAVKKRMKDYSRANSEAYKIRAKRAASVFVNIVYLSYDTATIVMSPRKIITVLNDCHNLYRSILRACSDIEQKAEDASKAYMTAYENVLKILNPSRSNSSAYNGMIKIRAKFKDPLSKTDDALVIWKNSLKLMKSDRKKLCAKLGRLELNELGTKARNNVDSILVQLDVLNNRLNTSEELLDYITDSTDILDRELKKNDLQTFKNGLNSYLSKHKLVYNKAKKQLAFSGKIEQSVKAGEEQLRLAQARVSSDVKTIWKAVEARSKG